VCVCVCVCVFVGGKDSSVGSQIHDSPSVREQVETSVQSHHERWVVGLVPNISQIVVLVRARACVCGGVCAELTEPA
jgi:hypothetical protein